MNTIIQNSKRLSPKQLEQINKNLLAGNPNAKKELVMSHLWLVKSMIKKHENRLIHLQLDDLYQIGVIGLINAANKFDPELGNKFSTFAWSQVRKEIVEAIMKLNENIRQAKDTKEKISAMKKAINELHFILGREATIEELSEALGWSLKLTNRVYADSQKREVSLNQTFGGGGTEYGDNHSEANLRGGTYSRTFGIADLENNIDFKIMLYRIKKGLTAQEYYIFYQRHILGIGQNKIAEKLAVTHQCISSRLKQIMIKVKMLAERKNPLKISQISNDLQPFPLEETVIMFYLKQFLSASDYEILYKYIILKTNVPSIAQETGILEEEIIRLLSPLVETFKKIKNNEDNYSTCIKSLNITDSRKYFELDIKPDSMKKELGGNQITKIRSSQ